MRCTLLFLGVVLVLTPQASAQTPPLDAHGDPLPAGATARLGSLRYRHDAPIVFAAFAPGAKSVISVSNDGVACVWEFPSGRRLQRLEMLAGGSTQITGATLAPDGKHLTAFADDGFMRIWDLEKSKELGKIAIATTPPAASASASSLSLAKSLARTTPSAGPAPTYSPDGKTMMLAGPSSRVLQLIDLAAGKEVRPNLGHGSPLIGIWFTPDGAQILTKDAKATHSWNVATGKDLGAAANPVVLPANAGSPTLISPDGKVGVTVARFATPAAARAAKVREAYLFDTATGKQLGIIELEVDVVPMHRKPLQFSPDSKLFAAVAGEGTLEIHLYDTANAKLVRSLDTGLPPAAPKGGFAKGGAVPFGVAANQKMLFSADGKALAVQSTPTGPILVLDTGTGKKLASIANPGGGFFLQGTFTPDGRCLALETSDGVVTLIELATGQRRRTYGREIPGAAKADPDDLPLALFGPLATEKLRPGCAISPDGALLAIPGAAGSVHVWDILSGKELTALKGHTALVSALAFSPNGKLLASASSDTTALVWDVARIARPARAAVALKADEIEKLWQALSEEKGDSSFAAMAELAAARKEAVAWIAARVKPVPPVDAKRVELLIQQLGSEQFKVRAVAGDELQKMGEVAMPFLEKALADPANPEAQRRLTDLHAKLQAVGLEGERLRAFRAIEVLEHIDTEEARKLLETFANGAPGALVTMSARRALKR